MDEVRKVIFKKPNVNGFGWGKLIRKGKETGEGIVVTVTKKLPRELLSEKDVIPRNIDGVATDVIEVGEITLLSENENSAFPVDRTQKYRPVPLGVSVGNIDITAGTSGFLVEKDDNPMMVSNNHVFACVNKCEIGSLIVQPGTYDAGGEYPENRIGTLYDYVPIKTVSCPYSNAIVKVLNFLAKIIGSKFRFQYKPVDFSKDRIPKNTVDCALCLLDSWDIAIPKPLEVDAKCYEGLASVNVGDEVIKTGRTTGVTKGIIRATDYECRVAMNKDMTEFAYFVDQLLIEPLPPFEKFSAPGDSGSSVGAFIDDKLYLIGLLFAGSEKYTVVNKISNVFEALHLDPNSLIKRSY